jgi:hypothetical protein
MRFWARRKRRTGEEGEETKLTEKRFSTLLHGVLVCRSRHDTHDPLSLILQAHRVPGQGDVDPISERDREFNINQLRDCDDGA